MSKSDQVTAHATCAAAAAGGLAPDAARLRERFEMATRLIRGWVWETDAQHRFCFLSGSIGPFSSKPPEWYYGKTRDDVGFVQVDEASREAYRLQLERHERFGPVEFQRDVIGKLLWSRTIGEPQFDPVGCFTGYCGIAYDITAEMIEREKRENAQAQRRQSLDILTTTIDCFPGGICVIDPQHRLAFSNELFYDHLGLPRDRFPVGTPILELFEFMRQRGDFRGNEDEAALHLNVDASCGPCSYERSRANGTRVVIRVAPLPGGGQVRTYTDITHRYERQWRLEDMIQHLQSRVWLLERGGLSQKTRNARTALERASDRPPTPGPAAEDVQPTPTACANSQALT